MHCMGTGQGPGWENGYIDMSMTQVHGSAEDMGEVISFQQKVGFNHVHCWKSVNIRGIPK